MTAESARSSLGGVLRRFPERGEHDARKTEDGYVGQLAEGLANASRDYSSVSQVFRAPWDYRRMEHRIQKKT